MATIQEVAKRAGVSAATVSKYLNGIKVKDKNKKAIDDAVSALHYRVNPIARGLRTNKSMTIGVLLPQLDNAFSTSIVSKIENIIMNYGYSTIICDYQANEELEEAKLDFLLKKQVDGLVIMPTNLKPETISDIEIPIVFIDRYIKNIECDCVLINNEEVTSEAVDKLIDAGHRKIGIICGPQNIYTSKKRLDGYLGSHKNNNISINDDYIKFGNYDVKDGYLHTKELLSLKTPPTAIIATNNETTIGALMAFNELGVKIGRDISFIGYDNIEFAMAIDPKMTVVLQPIEEIGEAAANILLSQIKEKKEPQKVFLPAKILEQNSVLKIN